MTDYERLLCNIPNNYHFFNAYFFRSDKHHIWTGKHKLTEESIENNLNGLQILSHNSFTDSLGYLHVAGEIKNNYPSTVTFVRIVGIFYDINDQVVGTQFTYANPSDIRLGEKAPFVLILTSASIPISQIDHYSLQASYQ
jgi:hypothetical protein